MKLSLSEPLEQLPPEAQPLSCAAWRRGGEARAIALPTELQALFIAAPAEGGEEAKREKTQNKCYLGWGFLLGLLVKTYHSFVVGKRRLKQW